MKFMLIVVSFIGNGWMQKVDVYDDFNACDRAAKEFRDATQVDSAFRTSGYLRAFCINSTNSLYNGERK